MPAPCPPPVEQPGRLARHGTLVTHVEGEGVVQIPHGDPDGAAPVHPGVVQQNSEHLRHGRARDQGTGRRVARGALQASAVPGEQSVPPFLGVPQQLPYRDLPGGRPGRLPGAGQAQHLLHRVVQTVGGSQCFGQHRPQPGVVVNLRIQDTRTRALRTVPFHYAGITKEFPTAPKDSFFVANASYIAKATGSDAVGAFLLDTGGSHQKQIAAQLHRQLGTRATVTDLTQTRGTVGTSLTSVDLAGLTRIELAFAVLLAAGAGGLVLALGLVERRRTFAIATVLGARTRQLRGMVLTEALLLAAGGLAGGTLIGWALSQMLVKALTGVFDPPPASLSVPGTYLALTGTAAVAAILAAALNGIRNTRRPAVEELRDL
jgi:putative ABC transport system permease protein